MVDYKDSRQPRAIPGYREDHDYDSFRDLVNLKVSLRRRAHLVGPNDKLTLTRAIDFLGRRIDGNPKKDQYMKRYCNETKTIG